MHMPRLIRKAARKIGLPPGALVHVGETRVEKPRITVIDFDPERVDEEEIEAVEECARFKDRPTVTWVNISGIHDVEVVEGIGRCFDLPHLLLEDVLHTGQRPKLEHYQDHVFIVLKILRCDDETGEVSPEQISLVLGPGYVLSFEERDWELLDTIRERIRTPSSRMRQSGPDYLTYRLVDTIVDSYFVALERLGEQAELLEHELLSDPTEDTLRAVYRLKREATVVRTSVWPLREVVSGLERRESPLIQATTLPYLRDVYDHTVQVLDTTETMRELTRGMVDTYLSSVSNKMNEVMKVLTMIATVFIPLSFLAGLYGMNFANMPELKWPWGYFAVLAVMGGVTAGMLAYFKKKGWL